MSHRRFGRGATTLKTQPVYAPGRMTGVGRSQYQNPKIHRQTPANNAPFRVDIPRWVWLVLVAGMVAGGVGWLIFGSATFKIQQIEIVGSVNEAVQAEIEGLRGTNILTYSSGGMTSRLKAAQSSIETLTIAKGLPRTLRIGVTLRDPVIRWERGSEAYLLDEDGIVFQYAPGAGMDEEVATLPRVVDLQSEPVVPGKKVMSRQFVTFIHDTATAFVDQFPIGLDHFELGQTSFEITLVTKSGWKAVLDTTRPPQPQLDSLQQVFEHFHDDIHEYVDLRIPGRAYFK